MFLGKIGEQQKDPERERERVRLVNQQNRQ